MELSLKIDSTLNCYLFLQKALSHSRYLAVQNTPLILTLKYSKNKKEKSENGSVRFSHYSIPMSFQFELFIYVFEVLLAYFACVFSTA